MVVSVVFQFDPPYPKQMEVLAMIQYLVLLWHLGAAAVTRVVWPVAYQALEVLLYQMEARQQAAAAVEALEMEMVLEAEAAVLQAMATMESQMLEAAEVLVLTMTWRELWEHMVTAVAEQMGMLHLGTLVWLEPQIPVTAHVVGALVQWRKQTAQKAAPALLLSSTFIDKTLFN
jgi:hypothetical protein